ncbi:hypothetical protein A5764_02860 [Mycobacterium sp. 852002-51057_SCH5723018]|nr:hypothetical protein A5764_02860 [Mycobacterium sp. 852002-51057_SCH5723018]
MTTIPLRLAHSDEDYRMLGLQPGKVSASEGRMHVDGSPGSFEWWFMKAELAECTVALGIITAPAFMGELGLLPCAQLLLTFPDGTVVEKSEQLTAEDFESFSNDVCSIGAGKSRFQRVNDRCYCAHFEADGVIADIDLTPSAPDWRPETGHIIFGENDEHYFGWAIPVPTGDIHVVIRGEGLNIDSHGDGYIDRGWMNQPLGQFLHNWNWFEGKFDDYTVLAVHMTFEEEYGYPDMPFFMVYRGAELLAGGPGTQNAHHITYTVNGTHVDAVTAKPVPDGFAFEYRDGTTRLTLSVRNETPTQKVNWDDLLPGSEEDKSRSSVHGGAVLRFTGPAELTHYEHDQVVASVRVPTGPFYELMYMGTSR